MVAVRPATNLGMTEEEHQPLPINFVAMLRPFRLSAGQVVVRRVDGRPGPQPLPGARPRMLRPQPEDNRVPFGGRERALSPPLIYISGVQIFPNRFLTALCGAGYETVRVMHIMPVIYVHRSLPYPEIHHATFVGAGDGRVRMLVQLRRASMGISDNCRGPRSMVQARRYSTIPESMLPILAAIADGRPGAAAHLYSQDVPDGSWEAALRNGGGRAGALPGHLRSQDLPDGLGQQDERAEDAPSAQIPPGAM